MASKRFCEELRFLQSHTQEFQKLFDDVYEERRLFRRHPGIVSLFIRFSCCAEYAESPDLYKTCEEFTEEKVVEVVRPLLDACRTYTDVVTYIRHCSLLYLDADIDTTVAMIDISSIGDASATAQMGFDMLKNVADSLVKPVKWLSRKTVDMFQGGKQAIFDYIYEAFKKALGVHFDFLKGCCTWMHTAFEKFKEWAQQIVDKTGMALSALTDAAWYGVGIVAAAALLSLLERFLVACGVLTVRVGIVSIFLSCCVVLVGSAAMMQLTSEAAKAVSETLSYTAGMIAGPLLTQMGMGGVHATHKAREQQNQTEAQDKTSTGQFEAVQALEGLAAHLSHFCDSGVVKVGRTFGAFNQIGQGCTALSKAGAKAMDGLWWMANKCFGLESKILADMATFLDFDLTSWLRECEAIGTYLILNVTLPREILERMLILLEQGKNLRTALMARPGRSSAHALSMVGAALKKLTELYETAVLIGSNLPRKCPFQIVFTGKPKTGKSTLVNKFTKDWLIDNKLPLTDTYARNTLDPFWSGYRRQSIVTYDDFGAVTHEPSDESEMIPLVSSNPFPLCMADIREKGMFFDSKLIAVSTNFKKASPDAKIAENGAFERRRHLLVEVTSKIVDGNAVEYSSEDFTRNQTYTILNSTAPFHPKMVFETYGELYAHIKTAMAAHDADQTKLMDSMPRPTYSVSKTTEKMLDVSTLLLAMLPESLRTKLDLQAGEILLGYWKKNLMVLKADACTIREQLCDAEMTEEVKMIMRKFSLQFHHILSCSESVDPIAMCYAKLIVEKSLLGENLECKDLAQDPGMAQIVNSLPKWQRIILFNMSEMFNEQGQGWFNHLMKKFKNLAGSVYDTEMKSWPIFLKIVLGVVLALLGGAAIYSTFSWLANLGTGATFVSGAAATFAVGQSVMPNRAETSTYTFRNKHVRARAWYHGQSAEFCFGDSYLWLIEQCHYTLRFADVVTQVAMLPGRKIVGMGHAFNLIPDKCYVELQGASGSKIYVCWRKEKIQKLKDNELAIYADACLPEVQKSVSDRIIWDTELNLPKVFSASFFTYRKFEGNDEAVPMCAQVNARKVFETRSIHHGEYVHEIDKSFQYEANTQANDCGSFLMAEVKGKICLVGLHVALADEANEEGRRMGIACPIPSEAQKFERKTASGQSFHMSEIDFYDEHLVPGKIGTGLCQAGIVKSKYAPAPVKTHFVEVPEEWKLGTPVLKVPAILSKSDERLINTQHSGFDPMRDGMLKYAEPAGPFEIKLLDEVADDIVCEWQDAADGFCFDETTMEEALNGIEGMEYFDSLVLGTSEGFPYTLERKPGEKGKVRYVEGEPGHLSLIEGTVVEQDIAYFEEVSKHEVPLLIGVETPKDEKVAIRKVFSQPKTRLFTVLPMSYNLVVRKKFLRFVRFIMLNRSKFPCQVGTNPFSRDWDNIADRLLAKGDTILCCDYKLFDGILPKEVMFTIAQMINKLCGGTEDLKIQRENLLMAACGRKAIAGRMVYFVENGIPSGFPLTVIVNSILNEMLVRYCYKKIFEGRPTIQNSFTDFVTMVAYGDDNLISVSACISDEFTGSRLQQEMKKIGVTITDGVDKTLPTLEFRRIEQCDFLKRAFVRKDDGLWYSPIEKESLWPQIQYVHDDKVEMQQAYIDNLVNVLQELYIHSVEECSALRMRALREVPFVSSFIPTIRKIAAFHEEQKGKGFNFNVASEVLLNIQLMGSVSNVENYNTLTNMSEVVPRVWVVSDRRYVPEEGDLHIRLNPLGPHRENTENTIYFRWCCATGRGGLPTTEWLRTVFVRKSEAFKTMKAAHVQGRRLVFSSAASVVPAYIFSTMFCRMANLFGTYESNVMLSPLVAAYKSLSFLPKDFEEFFF